MDKREMVAPCGIYCPGCPAYKAQFDEALAKELSEKFNLPIEKVKCAGCRPSKGIVMAWTRPCPTYVCAESKNVEFCSECDEFPCIKLAPYVKSPRPHNSKVYNLVLIKKLGIEEFLNQVEELTKLYYEGVKKHGGGVLKLPESK